MVSTVNNKAAFRYTGPAARRFHEMAENQRASGAPSRDSKLIDASRVAGSNVATAVTRPTGRPTQSTSKVLFLDLEFDTTPKRGAPLGDIASSLVSLHDLLRDLGSLAAYPSSAEFREIQVVAIEMGNPLTIKLSLLAISPEAVKAFQEICRDIILFRERHSHQHALPADRRADIDAKRRANINTALDLLLHADGGSSHLSDKEMQRLHGHILALQNAEIPLKRVVVTSG